MLQIIGYLLCVYLVFKGIEIWMIGTTAKKENNRWAGVIGGLFFWTAFALAILFAVFFTAQGAAMPRFGGY